MEIVFFIIAVIASAIGAVSGIGGGVILKPVMDAFHTMDISTINFLSACTVLTMAVSSFLRNRKSSVKLNYKVSIMLAVGASMGGIVGKSIFSNMEHGLAQIQSGMLLLMNVFVLIYILNKKRITTLQVDHFLTCIFIGFALGAVSSFLGIGGGPINIAILSYFFSMEAKETARNSLFVILFSQITSLFTTILTGSVPNFEGTILLLMCAGGVIGAFIGSAVFKKIDNAFSEKFFLLVLSALILLNIYNAIKCF